MTGPGATRPVRVRASRIRAEDRWVEALLLRDGRVVAAGAATDLEALAPDAAVLDLGGLTVTAGLTDAHVHLVEWALGLDRIDVGAAPTPEAAARDVADAAPPEGWVRGRGWNPHRWPEPPHRSHLDDAVGDRPVLLESHDLHSLWASSAALRAAGIDASTPDPEGGRIERDEAGEATGSG